MSAPTEKGYVWYGYTDNREQAGAHRAHNKGH